jgi:hypothetical protein
MSDVETFIRGRRHKTKVSGVVNISRGHERATDVYLDSRTTARELESIFQREKTITFRARQSRSLFRDTYEMAMTTISGVVNFWSRK